MWQALPQLLMPTTKIGQHRTKWLYVAVAVSLSMMAHVGLVSGLPRMPQWQAPVVVWESQGGASAPQLVTDAQGHVHFFFVDRSNDASGTILYHIAIDEGEPFVAHDILVGMAPDYRDYRVASDPFGRVHIVFRRENSMWHTAALGSAAGDAGAWSPPVVIGSTSPGHGFTIDGKGGLHVCYPSGSQILYQHSEDSGESWSEAEQVAPTFEPSIPVYLACAVDTVGVIHVAWSETTPPNYYPTEALFYTRSEDGGRSWQEPERIAESDFPLSTLVADLEGNVHLLWQGDVKAGGRFYRRLTAGQGRHWTDTETVIPAGQGGMSGDAPLVVDSNGNPHVLTAANGIKWIGRIEGGWSAPSVLSASLAELPNPSGSIEYPAFAIANGNQLHAVFLFDQHKFYYSSALLNAPEKRVTPAPSPPPSGPQAEAVATAQVSPSIMTATVAVEAYPYTNTSSAKDLGSLDDGAANRQWLIWVGPLLASLIVLWVVARERRLMG